MLLNTVDTFVMLAWPSGFNKQPKNRCHYAAQFAKLKPVIFVQPDLEESRYFFQESGEKNITILRISAAYGDEQASLLNQALLERYCLNPLFWVYNIHFHHFLAHRYSVMTVYHATEDYLCPGSSLQFTTDFMIDAYLKTLSYCQLIITASVCIKKSLESYVDYDERIVNISHEGDFTFNSLTHNDADTQLPTPKIAVYHGNIDEEIDLDLLHNLAEKMRDWTFYFFGNVNLPEEALNKWNALLSKKNAKLFGSVLPGEQNIHLDYATVGILPFKTNKWLVERSPPLCTLEYVKEGLPVVSIPIKSLNCYGNLIEFAHTPHEFVYKIEHAALGHVAEEQVSRRRRISLHQDYDSRFQNVLQVLDEIDLNRSFSSSKRLICIFYEATTTEIKTVEEYLKSFVLYSKHRIRYIPLTCGFPIDIDLNIFDILVFHYSVRLIFRDRNFLFSAKEIKLLQSFGGYKVLFIQDEYEYTHNAHYWIKTLGIHTVYSCVPQKYIDDIYPKRKFPYVNFINVLTGFAPIHKIMSSKCTPPTKRDVLIGYRGRILNFCYGTLGQEKFRIGVEVKRYCESLGLNVDIECDDGKRIYGDDWYKFLSSCRATLGTESGSHLFDFTGEIREEIDRRFRLNPALTFEDIYEELIEPNEIIKMNQISPKIFESILFKTALILFEGEYSGVLTPHVHYIPLKKDFSNLPEVIDKVQDDELINLVTENSYRDIILSGKYSYEKFIRDFDQMIGNLNCIGLRSSQLLPFDSMPECAKEKIIKQIEYQLFPFNVVNLFLCLRVTCKNILILTFDRNIQKRLIKKLLRMLAFLVLRIRPVKKILPIIPHFIKNKARRLLYH